MSGRLRMHGSVPTSGMAPGSRAREIPNPDVRALFYF